MSKEEEGLEAASEALYWLAAAIVRSVTHPRRISLTSVSTLSALGRLGPQRITELAALQGVTQPSMTAVIGALEQSAYVTRTPDPTDRRASLISLTAAGEDFLAERRRAGAERMTALARQLSPEDAAALAAAVPALVRLRALQEDPAFLTTASTSPTSTSVSTTSVSTSTTSMTGTTSTPNTTGTASAPA